MSSNSGRHLLIDSVMEYRSLVAKQVDGPLTAKEHKRLRALRLDLKQMFKSSNSQKKTQSSTHRLPIHTPRSSIPALLKEDIPSLLPLPVSNTHPASHEPQSHRSFTPAPESFSYLPRIPTQEDVPAFVSSMKKMVQQVHKHDSASYSTPSSYDKQAHEPNDFSELLHIPEKLV